MSTPNVTQSNNNSGRKPQPVYRRISEFGNNKGVKYLLRVLVDFLTDYYIEAEATVYILINMFP